LESPNECQRLTMTLRKLTTVKHYVKCFGAEWCAYEQKFITDGDPDLVDNPLVVITDSYRAPFYASAAISSDNQFPSPPTASLLQPDLSCRKLNWNHDPGILARSGYFTDQIRPLEERSPEEFCMAVSGFIIIPPKEKEEESPGWLRRKTESLRSIKPPSFSKYLFGSKAKKKR